MPSTIGLYSGTSAPEVAGTNTTSLYGGGGVPVPGANGNTVVRGDLTVTGNATVQGELTVGDDLCVEGDLITLRCNATTIGDATIEVERGASTNATIGWQESDTRWHYNFGITAPSLYADDVVVSPPGDPNVISTLTGSGADLRLDADTDQLRIAATNTLYNAGPVLRWSESSNRANRMKFQSNSGSSSGIQIIAPSTATPGNEGSRISLFNSDDIDNGTFLGFQSLGSTIGGTAPLRVQSGTYTAGVLGPSGQSVSFVDNTTTYATVNPAGPSASTDLVTVAYLTGGTFVFNQVNIDNRVYLDSTQLVTSTTTANQTLDTFAAATYRSAKYQISISSGSSVHVMEVLVMHDGTTAYQTVYADMYSGASLTTLNTTISGGNVLLRVTPTNAVTTYKVSRTLIVV